MATAQTTITRSAPRQSSAGLIGFMVKAVFWLMFSLIISIVIEWIGMTWWWPELGAQHSIQMYERELAYLAVDLDKSLVFSEPAALAAGMSGFVQELWERSGALDAIAWLTEPPPDARFREIIYGLHGYATAMVFITLVFAVRLAILILAMPVFALFALVALVDGLVERDLRRFSAGRESAYVFHLAKAAAAPMLLMTWAIYLAMPFSVHPSIVILPFAILFAVLVRMTAASFKKYL
ncbi:MAG: TIGR03747 family integrating conjugative element membrane protein [Geminicoccaceae bacterium]